MIRPVEAVTSVRDQTAYYWNNSSARPLRAARSYLDARPERLLGWGSWGGSDGVYLGYLGLPAGEHNVLRLLEHHREALTGPTQQRRELESSWAELRAGRWPEVDLLVVGAEQRRLTHWYREGELIAPFRVHLVVDTSGAIEDVVAGISKRERWQHKRDLEKHRWTLEEDPREEALCFFYQRMHQPTMIQRHGDRSRTEPLSVARRAILRRGSLFFLRQDGQRIAGALCRRDGRTLTTRLLGVLDGSPEHYESGAFRAVYHLLLRHAAQDPTIDSVDLFGTEALISKGIFQWKRKLGSRVFLPSNHYATKQLLVKVLRDTPAVRDFLAANPLIVKVDNGLAPVYFTDRSRVPQLRHASSGVGLLAPRQIDLDRFCANLPPDGRRAMSASAQ